MASTSAAADTTSPKVASPKSPSKSPPQNPQDVELVPAEFAPIHDDDDGDSALGDTDSLNSTESISSSILEYRIIRGRSYHAERHNSEYFIPIDERQSDSADITHHYLTLLLDGKLFLAPIKPDVKRVLDIGTGTGIWAIDFADEHPSALVTGTDLSPTQPSFVPPNLTFEIDDCTAYPWTWESNHFDFIHMRYLFGSITDWTPLFKEAYRVCAPGGWIESGEAECAVTSDDGTVTEGSAMDTWRKLFVESGRKIGRTFETITLDVQRKGMEEAGFVDIQTVKYKVPMSGWAADPKLAEVGRYVRLTVENDMEGYSTFLWNNVLEWPADEHQIFLMQSRKELRDRSIHPYFTVQYVYGRKPE